MKTTVKLSPNQSVSIEPGAAGGVVMKIITKNDSGAASVDQYPMPPATAGAFMFCFEQAAEAARVSAERARSLRLAHELSRAGA